MHMPVLSPPLIRTARTPQRTQPNVRIEAPASSLELNGLSSDQLPRLETVVTNAKHETIAHIEAALTSLVLSPGNRILYLEAACTSDSGAHALMGSVSDTRSNVEFKLFLPSRPDAPIALLPPDAPRISNTRLQVPGWSRAVHHVAILDRAGDLLLAGDDVLLWNKLRRIMSCPTLDGWGKKVMPAVHEAGVLIPCQAFGVPAGLKAYVLAEDAQDRFDEIISTHVRRCGGINQHARL